MIASKEYVLRHIKEQNITPSKRFGQNFLIDQSIALQAVQALAITSHDTVIEIGPGLGAISELISTYQAPTHLYEIDYQMVMHLKKFFQDCPWLKVHHQDFLKESFDEQEKVLVIGNLPYYITTPIIEKVLLEMDFVRFVFMVQAEVESRLVAAPCSKEYGPLTILLKIGYQIQRVCYASRQAFYPQPHVDSMVFKVTPTRIIKDKKRFYRFLKAMFKMRRKTLLNNLGSFLHSKEQALTILKQCQIAERRRPEELSEEEYLRLWDLLA